MRNATAPVHLEDEKIDLATAVWKTIAPGVERFRLPSGEPVRRIITGRKTSKVGGFYSHKNRGHVVHESDGEELCARVLEVHWAVRSFAGQPETLRIQVEDRDPEIYTPDFLADIGGLEIRIEFKWWKDLWPPRPLDGDARAVEVWEAAAETRRHLRAARDAYRRADLLMLAVTERHLKAMADLAVVDEIVANSGRPIDPEDRERLLRHLRAGPSSLIDCEECLRNSEFPRGDVLSRIPERLLRIDLYSPIGPETIVSLVED